MYFDHATRKEMLCILNEKIVEMRKKRDRESNNKIISNS